MNDNDKIPDAEKLQANTKEALESLDPVTCRFKRELNYQRPGEPVIDPLATPPRVQENIALCKKHLASKYGIYTRGQLSTCVSSLGHRDYQNNVPLW